MTLPYKLLAIAALIGGIWVWGYSAGHTSAKEKADRDRAELVARQQEETNRAQADATSAAAAFEKERRRLSASAAAIRAKLAAALDQSPISCVLNPDSHAPTPIETLADVPVPRDAVRRLRESAGHIDHDPNPAEPEPPMP